MENIILKIKSKIFKKQNTLIWTINIRNIKKTEICVLIETGFDEYY